MAKDTREILRGVRIGNVVYKPGQEDELEARLTAEQVKRLTENGTLQGDWKGGKGEVKAPEAKAETKPEVKPAK